MLKYQISYTDFNGTDHTDDLWFHISKTNVLMAKDDVYNTIVNLGKQLQQKVAFIQQIQAEDNDKDDFSSNKILVAGTVRELAKLLDSVIDLAYGIRTEDGLRFIKNAKVLEDFKQTLAYDALIDKLLSNPNEMVSFIEKLMKQ